MSRNLTKTAPFRASVVPWAQENCSETIFCAENLLKEIFLHPNLKNVNAFLTAFKNFVLDETSAFQTTAFKPWCASFFWFLFFALKSSAEEFMQYLIPVGAGPSEKTWPKWPLHFLQKVICLCQGTWRKPRPLGRRLFLEHKKIVLKQFSVPKISWKRFSCIQTSRMRMHSWRHSRTLFLMKRTLFKPRLLSRGAHRFFD